MSAQIEDLDFLVLGSGAGGKYLAWDMAREGLRSAVIERRYVGGSCPNIACLPSKNIIQSAKVASYFARSEEFGVEKNSYSINMVQVRARKQSMVDGLFVKANATFAETGTELVMGSGTFIAPRTIEVQLVGGGKRILRGKKVVISTGSRATIDTTPGLMASAPLTHIEALDLENIPAHLIVIGGGYIGLEFAQAMRRFGSRVTIVERNPRLAHREDEDVSHLLHQICKEEGIDIVTDAKIISVEGKSGTAVKIHLSRKGAGEMSLEGSHILAATGRTPNTDNIGLDLAGVEINDRGHVKVSERLETTAPAVWAVGDCAGSPQFTHIAHDDRRIIRENLKGGSFVTTGRQVPFCMFTDPELARVGLSETEAKAAGISYRLSTIPMAAIPRAVTVSETRGFMKALIATDSDTILGFTAFGLEAGELLATVQMAMLAKMPYTVLRDAVFTHPTMNEGLTFLFAKPPVLIKG